MSPTAVLESTEWPSFVCSSLAKLRQEGVLCDTTLLGKNGRTLLAHSCILAAASPVLRTIVTQQNLVAFLHKADFIPRGVWDVILEFIYRGKVTIETVTDAHDIMVAAEKLELEKLRSLCEDFLHIEGAILKNSSPIVLDDETHADMAIIKTEPDLSPTCSVAQNVQTEIDAASYGSVVLPNMGLSGNSEVSTSVRIKSEPIDDSYDKNLTSNSGSHSQTGQAIITHPLATESASYPFITHASSLVSSSISVSQPVSNQHEWTTAPMASDLSGRVPLTIPVAILHHKLPVLLSDTGEATTVSNNNITHRLPLTRALLSTSQTQTTPNSVPQRSQTIPTTHLSSCSGHDDLPALVTMNPTSAMNTTVTTGSRLDSSGQSVMYSPALTAPSIPVSSTVEDEGPLCLVMPKKKVASKTRRRRRPAAIRPDAPPISSCVDPSSAVNSPSFQTPSSLTQQQPTQTPRTYPASVTGEYQPPSGPSTDLCPAITPHGMWGNSELRRRLASKQCTELGTATSVGAADVALAVTTGHMSPSSIAQAEVPAAAVPLQVAAPGNGSREKMSEGQSVEDQRVKEQIAVEVISQLSDRCNVMGRGRRKKTMTMKRRHPSHNGFLPSQKPPKLTIKLKTPKRHSSCSLSTDLCPEISEPVLTQNDSSLQCCDVVMYDTTAVEPGTNTCSSSHSGSTCMPTTVIDVSQLTMRNVMNLHSPRMSEERQLMRPWLEMQLGANAIPGLHWLNEEKTLARIPWLHASRTSYQMDTDSCLFMMWAEHTGKYVPSRDEPDPKRWKANFRCALNSLADVLEVKDSSQKRGREAFKVYEFLPQTKKSRRHSMPHANNGRKKKEETSSSGAETEGVKTVGRRLVPHSPGPSETHSKVLTGREIMSVMRRKDGVISGDMTAEESAVVAAAAAAMTAIQSQSTTDVTLKPDSTSSTVPSPDHDTGSREECDVPVSPSETSCENPSSQTAAADTSTHCVIDTVASQHSHKTLPAQELLQWDAAQPGTRQTGFSCKECSQWFSHSTMLARHQLTHVTSVKTHKDMVACMKIATANHAVEQKSTKA